MQVMGEYGGEVPVDLLSDAQAPNAKADFDHNMSVADASLLPAEELLRTIGANSTSTMWRPDLRLLPNSPAMSSMASNAVPKDSPWRRLLTRSQAMTTTGRA